MDYVIMHFKLFIMTNNGKGNIQADLKIVT